MRIVVFAAAGSVGSRVVREALSRGHQVTAVVRDASRFQELPEGAIRRVGDAQKLEDVVSLTAGQDLVISATRPAVGRERDLVSTAETLLGGLRHTGARLLLVGGAASLIVPGTRRLAIDDPRFIGPEWRAIAEACSDQLEVCRGETQVRWTYVSPPALLEPGERTGAYRIGSDELLLDSDGQSRISIGDLAAAILDEAEQPRYPQARFTAGY